MRKPRLRVGAGAILCASALYLLLDYETLAALLLAVAVHELGHVLVLRLLGGRVRELRVGLTGLCITYTGRTGYAGQFFAALAGPAAGLAFAFFAARLGREWESGFCCLSAGISALLSAFNLLPALPLDGGRMLEAVLCAALPLERAERACARVGTATGAALLVAGLTLLWMGRGAALAIAAVWLLFSLPDSGQSLAKRAGVM